MRPILILLLGMTGLFIIPGCKPKSAVVATAPVQGSVIPGESGQTSQQPLNIARAVNDFSFSLTETLGSKYDNLVFSPYSISSALAMTWAGASKNTAEEMGKVLHFSGPPENIHLAFRSLAGQLELIDEPGMTLLTVANALWAQEDYRFLKEYTDLTAGYYNAGLNNLDFTNAASCEQSRKIINQWVGERTNYKILELIGPGMLTPLTRLVLTNAIWFTGPWIHPFDMQNSSQGVFKVSPGMTATVTYMKQVSGFGYYEDNDLQAVALPYQGNDIAMLVVLPRIQKDLKQSPAGLSGRLFDQIISNLARTEVDLSFPRFKTETEINLNQPLQTMGMQEAFNRDADFSGMTGNKDLFIDFIIHKAFIDVNEKGTEAAAATGLGMALKSGYMGEPVLFTADHPFQYFIYHRESGLILFHGRFIKP